ncbi:MAG: hypothetical protein COA33_011965 [Fluviicola sp.]|nr:hypothetical protein [Fluviicola sp.]
MLSKVNNRYLVSANTKALFNEKLNYIQDILNQIEPEPDPSQIENKHNERNNIDLVDLSPEDFDYHNSEVEMIKTAAKQFPRILHSSIFVSAHSIFEATFSDIRKDVENLDENRIKLKHLKGIGSEISNVLNYFDLVHNLNFSMLDEKLETMKGYSLVRNTIVHQNGNMSKLDDSRKNRLIKFIKSQVCIEIEGENIIIDKKFVNDYVNSVLDFGLELFERIQITK